VRGAFHTSGSERLRQIARYDEDIRRLASMCDSHIQRLVRKDVIRINENAMAAIEQKAFADFNTWLSSTPHKEHHIRHSKSRLIGSTQWLLGDARYLHWQRHTTSSMLWLRGIMGSGKTNLVSAVVDAAMEDRTQGVSAAPILYYYCGDQEGSGGKCDPQDVMRSLLRQLSVKEDGSCEIVEQVLLEFQRRQAIAKSHMGPMGKLEPSECTRWIIELLRTDQVFIIIDAIDEIHVSDRHLLLKELIALRDSTTANVKIFLSSRDDTNLSQWLDGIPDIRMQTTSTRDDMHLFVHHRVSMAIANKQILDGVVDSDLQFALENYLLDRADGM
jgi:hypothetical protein